MKARRRFRPSPCGVNKGEEEPVSPLPLPEESAQLAELTALAQCSLLALSTNLREVVVLRLYEGLDYANIAEVVGVDAATARPHVR